MLEFKLQTDILTPVCLVIRDSEGLDAPSAERTLTGKHTYFAGTSTVSH
jgi:hypothetical protein